MENFACCEKDINTHTNTNNFKLVDGQIESRNWDINRDTNYINWDIKRILFLNFRMSHGKLC